MNEILFYQGLSLLLAAGFGFVLLLLILRAVSGNRRPDSVNRQWEAERNVEKEPEPIDSEVGEGTEVYVCGVCNWVYNENNGEVDGGIKPGIRFKDIPDTWVCPICGVGKEKFNYTDYFQQLIK